MRSQKVFSCSVAHVRGDRSRSNLFFEVERWGFYMGQFKPTNRNTNKRNKNK